MPISFRWTRSEHRKEIGQILPPATNFSDRCLISFLSPIYLAEQIHFFSTEKFVAVVLLYLTFQLFEKVLARIDGFVKSIPANE
jgi:hypothetical protein